MDLFRNAKAVRLRSHHDKYLVADEDEESVTQDRNGYSKNAKWTVEVVPGSQPILRFKSCYGRYLTASNQPFLLGMTGRKVFQTLPRSLDSSVEWEPIREGEGAVVKLKTRNGNLLRANSGLPPWRNSVTHDIPHRTATQDWVLWHFDAVDIEMPKELDHFLHKHPLKLDYMVDDKDSVMCAGCEKRVLGRSYCCRPCKFYLHESCTNIPVEICHFMHSCPLILVISYSRKCEACGEPCRGFLYDCGRCSWGVHYACTLKQLPNTEAQEQIEAPLHRHPLSIVENIREDHRVLCDVCEEPCCFGPIYYNCSACDFDVHKSCLEIPRQLYSIYHSCRYFLVLLICPSYECGACRRGGFGVSYACIRCGFKLHLKCALRFAGNINKDLQLQHICHTTGTLPMKTDCLGCKFPLEEPCSVHPIEVQTPLHPKHTLFLCKTTKHRRCNVCLDDCSSGLIFRCDKCDFHCNSECVYLMPTVKFANHDSHLLTVVDKIFGETKCNACQKTCLGMPGFRCSECEFTLHLLCGPLPHTIEYDHIHPLTLEDYFLDTFDEQYCFFCEEKRNPLLPVYNCKRCFYTAEINCVMSEVMASLRGEREEHIALRCINKLLNKKNKVIIGGGDCNKVEENDAINEELREEVLDTKPSSFLAEIFDCLNEDEQHKFLDVIKTMVEELNCLEYDDKDDDYSEEKCSEGYIGSVSEESSFYDNSDESSEEIDGSEARTHYHSILEVSPYSEKAFTQFIEKLDSNIDSRDTIKLIFSEDEKQLVKYDKYITPRVFIPILKELMNGKHGDISSRSIVDPRVKSICFMYLSELIYVMQTTKVVQIKKDKLQTWWNRTKMLQFVGFKVDFIQDHLMLVARAYFGLRARNFADKTSQRQVSKIEQLEKEIKDLMAKAEKFKVKNRNLLEYVESATTPFMVKCFSDAKSIKWRPAAYSLL